MLKNTFMINFSRKKSVEKTKIKNLQIDPLTVSVFIFSICDIVYRRNSQKKVISFNLISNCL